MTPTTGKMYSYMEYMQSPYELLMIWKFSVIIVYRHKFNYNN